MKPTTPAAGSLSRRDALKIIGTTMAATGLGLGTASATESTPAPLGWELPKLAYGYDALEPHIDARTMEIHHTKHHQAYITNARNLLKDHPDLLARGPEALVRDLASVPESIRAGIRNNAGGHVNHAFFWSILTSPGTDSAPSAIQDRLAGTFGGSMVSFKEQFSKAALARFGSGWTWVSAKADGNLVIHSTANQDSPLSEGLVPILGLDVWEHAYYLHYQNRRADYIAAFWNVIDWSMVGWHFQKAMGLR